MHAVGTQAYRVRLEVGLAVREQVAWAASPFAAVLDVIEQVIASGSPATILGRHAVENVLDPADRLGGPL